MDGIVNFLSGLSAEHAVAADYERRGFPVVAKRWRGSCGEIDLIVKDGNGFVFVEVKKSKSIASASHRLSQAQIERIFNTALEFVSHQPRGQLTEMRFDFARVDAQGKFDILVNVMT